MMNQQTQVLDSTEKEEQGFWTPSPQMNVGLLVWAAVLMVIGLVLVVVPASSIASFRAVVVVLLLLTGFVFLALAYYLHKEGSLDGLRNKMSPAEATPPNAVQVSGEEIQVMSVDQQTPPTDAQSSK